MNLTNFKIDPIFGTLLGFVEVDKDDKRVLAEYSFGETFLFDFIKPYKKKFSDLPDPKYLVGTFDREDEHNRILCLIPKDLWDDCFSMSHDSFDQESMWHDLFTDAYDDDYQQYLEEEDIPEWISELPQKWKDDIEFERKSNEDILDDLQIDHEGFAEYIISNNSEKDIAQELSVQMIGTVVDGDGDEKYVVFQLHENAGVRATISNEILSELLFEKEDDDEEEDHNGMLPPYDKIYNPANMPSKLEEELSKLRVYPRNHPMIPEAQKDPWLGGFQLDPPKTFRYPGEYVPYDKIGWPE